MSKVSTLVEHRMFLQQLPTTHIPRCGGLIRNKISITTPLEDLSGVRYLHLRHIFIDISPEIIDFSYSVGNFVND